MPQPTETPYLRAAFLAAPLAAVGAMAFATVLTLLAQGSDGGSIGSAVRTGAHVWLVATGAGLTADGIDISIVPVGAFLVVVGIVVQVVRWVLPDPVDDLPAFVGSTAGVHGVVGAIIAAVTGSGGVEVSPVRAAVAAFLAGGLGAGLGAVGAHGGGAALWFTVSDHVRRAVRGAVPGVVTLLGVAILLVVASLLTHIDRAGDLWALLDPGVGGGLALALGCLLAVPNLVLWAAAVLIGPGFALGTDTSVDLTGAQLGAVPGFPVLAALPSPGEFPAWAFLLGLVPLAAGAVAGWRADSGGRDGLVPRLVAGAAAGGVAGFVVGILIGLSGGAIGPGRMVETGPPALTPLLVAVPVMAMGGGIGAALAHYRGQRAQPSERSPEAGAVLGEETGSGRRPRLWKRHQPAGPDRRDGES